MNIEFPENPKEEKDNIMIKIILLCSVIISSYAFAQTETKAETTVVKKKYAEYVLQADVVKSEKGFYTIDKVVKINNGKNQEVDVKFSVSFKDYEPSVSDLGKININTDQTLWLAKFNLKNKASFHPFDILVSKNPTSWTIFLKYTAQNNLGVEKEGLKVYKYDLKGKEIK